MPSFPKEIYKEVIINIYTSFHEHEVTPRNYIIIMVFMQLYNLKTGLRLSVYKGENVVTKELTQLQNMEIFIPVNSTKLTKQEILKALLYLMFLREKFHGRAKSRGCADRRKHRKTIIKVDYTYPTVALEIIIIMSSIETHKDRDANSIDIPGTYLYTENKTYVIMLLRIIL